MASCSGTTLELAIRAGSTAAGRLLARRVHTEIGGCAVRGKCGMRPGTKRCESASACSTHQNRLGSRRTGTRHETRGSGEGYDTYGEPPQPVTDLRAMLPSTARCRACSQLGQFGKTHMPRHVTGQGLDELGVAPGTPSAGSYMRGSRRARGRFGSVACARSACHDLIIKC